ncbi:eL24 family ribosomal protein [Hymenobacter daeguensis]
MEDYAAKMLLKTDAALREYVTGHVQYREAAVLAALDELRRRGQPAPEEAALRPGLEAGAAAQRTLDEAAEAERRETATEAAIETDPEAAEAAGPALYSPISIVLFSIPTLLVGGVLMCMNLYRLGRKQAVLGLGLFIIVYGFMGSFFVNMLVMGLGLSIVWGTLLLNVSAALIYVLWFWPRYVGNIPFRSRSILGPVVVCMLLMWSAPKIASYIIRQQPKEVQQQFEKMMPKQ